MEREPKGRSDHASKGVDAIALCFASGSACSVRDLQGRSGLGCQATAGCGREAIGRAARRPGSKGNVELADSPGFDDPLSPELSAGPKIAFRSPSVERKKGYRRMTRSRSC